MLRTAIFMLVLILNTLWAAVAVMLVGIFNPFSRINSAIMRIWSRILLWAGGVKVQVEGKENVRPGESYIVVANHQSHMDIPVAVVALPFPVRIVSKKELFKIPVFGWGMRAAGIIEIDRFNRKQAIETLKRTGEIARRHHLSILVFPEGTRSPDGKIHSFKKGPFVMAINTGIPVLPISISGTRNILPKKKLRIRSGRVKVKIHSPIPTADLQMDDRHNLLEETHKQVMKGFTENYG